MRVQLAIIIVILACLFSSSQFACAQSELGGSADPDFEGNAGAVIINGLHVSKHRDLDFGVIAPHLTQSGTVKVNRDSNRSSECSAYLTCLKKGSRARFRIVGEPGRMINMYNPGSIYIYDGAGNSMLVDGFFGAGSGNNDEWKGYARIRNSGVNRPNVGAILHVNPNQPAGNYVGTFVFNVEYQ